MSTGCVHRFRIRVDVFPVSLVHGLPLAGTAPTLPVVPIGVGFVVGMALGAVGLLGVVLVASLGSAFAPSVRHVLALSADPEMVRVATATVVTLMVYLATWRYRANPVFVGNSMSGTDMAAYERLPVAV